ncbi:hypothetical protein [Rickettsia endosymbiont of Orchestes rusci]
MFILRWPRRQEAPRHDGLGIHATMPHGNDIKNSSHATKTFN